MNPAGAQPSRASARPPAMSVVMPVRDARPYLERSIASVLGQTLGNLELLIVENGSADGSGALLRALAPADRRIRLVAAPRPLGSGGAANLAVSHARAEVIARMDADDLCHPRRLESQLEALERHPDAVLVGTLYEGIDEAGRRTRPRDLWSLTGPAPAFPFPHGSICFRRSAFEAVGGYRPECEGWEDLDLVRRLAETGRILVLPSALYAFRFHARSITARMSARAAVDAAAAHDRDAMRQSSSREAPRSEDARILDVLYQQAAMRLWSGQRPGRLGELAARGLRRGTPRGVGLFSWAAWGRLSPGTLRQALRLWILARDRAAALKLRTDEPVDWHFGRV